MPAIKYAYMQNFMLVGVSVIEIREFNKKKINKNYETRQAQRWPRLCQSIGPWGSSVRPIVLELDVFEFVCIDTDNS